MKFNRFACNYPKHQCQLEPEKEFSMVRGLQKLKLALLGLIMISEDNFRSQWYLRSKGAIQLEINKQKKSPHWYFVHPFSRLRLFWETIMLPLFILSLAWKPVKCGFLNAFAAEFEIIHHKPLDNFYVMAYLDLFFNLMWLFDRLGTLLTGYYDKVSGTVIMEPSSIYKTSWIIARVVDVTGCIPVDFFLIDFTGVEGYARLTKKDFIFWFAYQLYSCIKFKSFIVYCYQFQKFGTYSLLVFRLITAVVIYFLLINWILCFTLVIPQALSGRDLYSESSGIKSWFREPRFANASLSEQYIGAFVKALHPNFFPGPSATSKSTIEDYLLAGFMTFAIRIYWTYYLVSFLESTTASQVLKSKFYLIREQLKTYMKQKAFSSSVSKRLNRLYLYRFQAHYFRDRAIQSRLTESLRKEIGMYTCERLIHNTEVFERVPKKMVSRLVRKMNRELYFPNDVIIRGNTFGDCMYFICSGKVAVWTVNGKEICQLSDGDFFGEIALIAQDRRRPTTITAITVTELYMLESHDYKKLVQQYPEVHKKLQITAMERFKIVMKQEKFEQPKTK